MTKQRRAGTTLIEVLVALVLLATAGTGFITLLGQTAHSMRGVRDTERLVNLASAQLDQLVLFDRAQLAARQGRAPLGRWSLEVIQRTPELFDVSIAATDTSAALLSTTLYRPDTTTHATTP
jgi:Tfp pilus assembly protein PilV